jgi:phosphoglycolate phosphatase-like HAD superfamily hydrolase
VASNGEGTGDYTIRILELKSTERKPETKPETKPEQLARLKKELDAVRAREAALVEDIKKLEAELKK